MRARSHSRRRRPASAYPTGTRTNTRFWSAPLVDRATLEQAEAEALDCGVAIHEVLLAAGLVSQLDYAAALARRLGVPVVAWDTDLDLADAAHGPAARSGCRRGSAGGRAACWRRRQATPATLFQPRGGAAGAGHRSRLAPQLLIDAALEAQLRSRSGSTGRCAAC